MKTIISLSTSKTSSTSAGDLYWIGAALEHVGASNMKSVKLYGAKVGVTFELAGSKYNVSVTDAGLVLSQKKAVPVFLQHDEEVLKKALTQLAKGKSPVVKITFE